MGLCVVGSREIDRMASAGPLFGRSVDVCVICLFQVKMYCTYTRSLKKKKKVDAKMMVDHRGVRGIIEHIVLFDAI